MGNSKTRNKDKQEEGHGRKPLTPKQMSHNTQQSLSQAAFLRSPLSWLFTVSFLLYVLYSSNILLSRDRRTCPSSSSTTTPAATAATSSHAHISTQERLNSFANSSLKPASLRQNKQEHIKDGHDHEFEHGRDRHGQRQPTNPPVVMQPTYHRYDTTIKHVVFGIAASSILWDTRKEYIKSWWRPRETRGVVWVDKKVRAKANEGLPQIMVSGDTSKFSYTHRQGDRSALRISRVVSETLRLGMKDVRWFVMGDDDTVFMVDNVVRVLSKYDHTQFYYVGSSSESHVQNIFFSYSMAFGGGGFAISYPLARELEKMQDRCIQRYPALYGSDDRIQACMSELGVPLSKEPGFHQYDVYGDLLGLLGAHPVTPLVSLHHIDVVQPVFPGMTRARALRHLLESAKLDSASIMQQSICYDRNRFWSISVSWGFVVQIIRGIISPRELEMPSRTFLNWYRRADYTAYAFNTRPVARHPCQRPFIFYLSSARYDEARKQVIGYYSLDKTRRVPACRWKMDSPEKIETVIVMKKPDPLRWEKSPRRDCCRLLPSRRNSTMNLWVGNCRDGEISELKEH